MINKEKALNLLGLAMKAGKLKTGQGATLDAIRSTRAKLVIMASDASPNTQKYLMINANPMMYHCFQDSHKRKFQEQLERIGQIVH